MELHQSWYYSRYESLPSTLLDGYIMQCFLHSSYSYEKRVIELKDYIPISLIESVYKIIAKVLVKMLKNIMEKLVSKHQNVFLKDRQIIDASLISNEVLHWKIKNGGTGILCKLDIDKTFNQLNRSYLLFIIRRMGLGETWIK